MVFNGSIGGLEPRGEGSNPSTLTKVKYDAVSSGKQAVSSGETPVLCPDAVSVGRAGSSCVRGFESRFWYS